MKDKLSKMVIVQINVMRIINIYKMDCVYKDVLVFMLIQQMNMCVVVLVTIIKLMKLSNNVLMIVQMLEKVIFMFMFMLINTIIDMNVLKNVINIHTLMNNNKQYVHKK